MSKRSPGRVTFVAAAFGLVSLAVLAASGSGAPPPKDRAIQGNLKPIETPYYIMNTDVPLDEAKEAAARMTAMAEEYFQRCQGFSSGTIHSKLPFYLFAKHDDYTGSGAPAGSAGVFMGNKLLADASHGVYTWHIVQHEGFHQFAASMISPRLPVWVNEGLAEYFGEAIWTGGGMVTGNIPMGRVKMVQEAIDKNELVPFETMLSMSHATWNGQMKYSNYNQAFLMVTFLVQAQNGKYQQQFANWIKDVAGGKDGQAAFAARFGKDFEGFQKRFSEWVKEIKDEDSAPLRIRAVMETLTCYLARAHCEGQDFDAVEDFFKAGEGAKVKIKNDIRWFLPPALLAGDIKLARDMKGWTLENTKDGPRLTLQLPDGTVYTGTMALDPKGPPTTKVTMESSKAATKPADKADATTKPS